VESIDTFGQWIKRRRKLLDLTQEQLAQQVGCSPTAIKKIESNERRPSRQMALLLATNLQLTTEQCDLFIRVARGQLPLDRLPLPAGGVPAPSSVPASIHAAPMNIPHPATPLIGRDRELAEITRLVQEPQCQLLTLTGLGGTGKTRLAIEAARLLQGKFADGVYFVSLAGVDTPNHILPAVANALGISFYGPNDTKQQFFHYLHGRQTLLVLDNLEHLLDGIDLFGELLKFAPGVTLLVTSREQLHLQSEWVFEVRGLPFPQAYQMDATEQSEAFQLFLWRARQAKSDFQIDQNEYEAVGRICKLVHGLPLAIELAAMWTRMLSCEEIVQEIERGLEFLAVNSRAVAARDVAPRHRSLQAVFDHSWDLLVDEERNVLMRLSVFRGGFSREAAEQIAGANMMSLVSLLDKSLIWRVASGRYDIHPLIRQYLAVRLKENAAEEQATCCKYSRYYLGLLKAQEAGLRSSRQKDTLLELDREIDNIRFAWSIAIENGLLDLLRESAEPLYYNYELRQYFCEAEDLFRQAVDADRLKDLKAYMANFQAFFTLRQGKNREAITLFETSLPILRRNGPDRSKQDQFPLTFALVHLGVVYWAMGEFEKARQHMEEGLSLSRSIEQTWLRGMALGFLGSLWHDLGDYPRAYEFLHEAMKHFWADGDPYLTLFIGIYYCRTLMVLNRLDEAQSMLQDGLRGIQETGNRWLTALGLEYLARVARVSGDDRETLRLLEESVQLHREVGDPWSLALALLELSRYKLSSSDLNSAEHYILEALKMAIETNSTPVTTEGLGILAAICAERGLKVEALCMLKYILQHPSSKQDTRDHAASLHGAITATLDATQQATVQKSMLPACFEGLMKERFGICLPSLSNP
jgi:predicted ATPase/transcriptional regulator with XRE-family HTH domain